MYNRYIPQSDGSYQRSRLPDQETRQSVPRPSEHKPQPVKLPPAAPPVCPPPRPKPERKQAPAPSEGVGSFLRNLLPKDFDTEDLLVILLFLLMSRDSEDHNSALLTLALYLFM